MSSHESGKGEFIVRKAMHTDGEGIMNLIRELALYEKLPEEVTVSFETFLECGFGEQPVWSAYIAAAKNEVVGVGLYYVRYSTWKGPQLYLEDLIVTENWRGMGIGKVLFERVIQEAKDRNLSGMTWQVLDWNEPAIHFYRKYKEAKLADGWLNCSIIF